MRRKYYYPMINAGTEQKQDRKLSFFLFFLVLLALLAACTKEDAGVIQETESIENKVVLYGSIKESQIAAVKKGFMEKYPDIRMEYYSSGTGNVVTKLAAEQQTGSIEADLIWIGDPTYYERFRKQGILMSYESPSAEDIPNEFIEENHYYIAARLIIVGFVCNSTNLGTDKAPRSWSDLLKPELKDQVVFADPVTSGTSFFTIAGLVQHPDYGWDYITRLKENGAQIERTSTRVVENVALGKSAVGIGVDYIARESKAKGNKIAFIYPEEDIPLIESPIAIASTTKNPKSAQLLYDYILSEEGQTVLAKEYSMPINPRVEMEDSWLSSKNAYERKLPVEPDILISKRTEILGKFNKIFAD